MASPSVFADRMCDFARLLFFRLLYKPSEFLWLQYLNSSSANFWRMDHTTPALCSQISWRCYNFQHLAVYCITLEFRVYISIVKTPELQIILDIGSRCYTPLLTLPLQFFLRPFSLPSSPYVNDHMLLGCPVFSKDPHNSPFLANSTFLAASPALKPPFEIQIALPSANSNFSSCAGCGQGQWCGNETQARVSGQR